MTSLDELSRVLRRLKLGGVLHFRIPLVFTS